MNETAYTAASKLVPTTTSVQQGRDARRTHERHIRVLIEQRKLPDEGWSDLRIELLLQELSLMDSNNFPENVGVGEREGRVVSELVSRRHFRLAHGVGRSGDIAAAQPKAAGSSIIAQLTNSLLLDIVRHAGVRSAQKCVLLPVATGMALLLVLLTLRQKRAAAQYVLWPRIDQKSCFKCIVSAGFQPVVIENILEGEELRTDVGAVEEQIKRLGPDSVACVLTTTSCFAPRAYDKLPEIGGLCKEYAIPHIVNNAYGVQSTKCMHIIEEAHRLGRVDAFVQSTDKNFLVPVGGSVVASSSEPFVREVAQIYPGRGSGTPCLDVFITLLSLGQRGYKQLCIQRKENYAYLKEKLSEVCGRHGERVLETRHNPISLGRLYIRGVTLSGLPQSQVNLTEFGSMLFLKNISGTRVVAPGDSKTIGPHVFTNWGSHHDRYPTAYFTVAAAIGMSREEVDVFLERLDKVFVKFKKKHTTPQPDSDTS